MLKWLAFLGLLAYVSSTSFEGRIVGGNGIDVLRVPYVVSLRYKTLARPGQQFEHHCGGAILSKNTIITAADCVEGNVAKNFLVVAGSSNTAGSDGIVIPVEKITIHPNYDYNSIKYNVALLKLQADLNLNGASVSAIKLADATPETGKALLSGFGKENEDGKPSETLKQIEIPIISNYICRQIYLPDVISSDMFCAGNLEGGLDGCEGDAGSPLVYGESLIGVLSFGRGCGRQGYPSVYTSIGHVQSWIVNEL